jgi:hypothetical protein
MLTTCTSNKQTTQRVHWIVLYVFCQLIGSAEMFQFTWWNLISKVTRLIVVRDRSESKPALLEQKARLIQFSEQAAP